MVTRKLEPFQQAPRAVQAIDPDTGAILTLDVADPTTVELGKVVRLYLDGNLDALREDVRLATEEPCGCGREDCAAACEAVVEIATLFLSTVEAEVSAVIAG